MKKLGPLLVASLLLINVMLSSLSMAEITATGETTNSEVVANDGGGPADNTDGTGTTDTTGGGNSTDTTNTTTSDTTGTDGTGTSDTTEGTDTTNTTEENDEAEMLGDDVLDALPTTVKDAGEFIAAWNNSNVAEIELTANITISNRRSEVSDRGTDVVIKGGTSKYTLTLSGNNNTVASLNLKEKAKLTLRDINIKSSSTTQALVLGQSATGASVVIDGTVVLTSAITGATTATIYADAGVTVNDGANLTISSKSEGIIVRSGGMSIGDNATVTLGSYETRVPQNGLRIRQNLNIGNYSKVTILSATAAVINDGTVDKGLDALGKDQYYREIMIGEGSTLEAGGSKNGIIGFRKITVADNPAPFSGMSLLVAGHDTGTDDTLGYGIRFNLGANYQAASDPANPEYENLKGGLFLGKNTTGDVVAGKIGISTNATDGKFQLIQLDGSKLTVGTNKVTVSTPTGITAFQKIVVGESEGTIGATLNVQSGKAGSIGGHAIQANGTESSIKILGVKSTLTANSVYATGNTKFHGLLDFKKFIVDKNAIADIQSHTSHGISNVESVNVNNGSKLSVDAAATGIYGSKNIRFYGENTVVGIKANTYGIRSVAAEGVVETGTLLDMADDASMTIEMSGSDSYGIRGIESVNLTGTATNPTIIKNKGTFSAWSATQAFKVEWSNLRTAVFECKDVTIANNVEIGKRLATGYHDRENSPRVGVIDATNSIRITGSGNKLYGGGYEAGTWNGGIPIVSEGLDGVVLKAPEVEISGSNNDFLSNDDRVKIEYAAVSASRSFKITSLPEMVNKLDEDKKPVLDANGKIVKVEKTEKSEDPLQQDEIVISKAEKNTFVGRYYGVKDSIVEVSIAGNSNVIKGLEYNAVDTSAPKVDVAGNNNTISGSWNGILNWNSASPIIKISGTGNKVSGSYNKDDNYSKGTGINITDSKTGTVEITGPKVLGEDQSRNEITGYRFGIKTAYSKDSTITPSGTLKIGGNTYVSSNSDMTAIARTVIFTSGNVEMRYWARVTNSATGAEISGAKKSVLWAGSNTDQVPGGENFEYDASVTVEKDANAFLIGWGYMDAAKPLLTGNQISSPIHSSYATVNVKNGGTLGIRSRGNAINWYRDKIGGSATDEKGSLNRGNLRYIVRAGGRMDLFSETSDPNVAVVQKLPQEVTSKAGTGGIVVQSGGSMTAYGLRNAGYVFDLPVSTDFIVDNPKLIDFANFANSTNAGEAVREVFSKRSVGNPTQGIPNPKFIIENSNISLWKKTSEIKDPAKPTVTLNGDAQEAINIMNSKNTTPDYNYANVEKMTIESIGTGLILTAKQQGGVTQFQDDFNIDSKDKIEDMTNIRRLRSTVKGRVNIYYLRPEVGAEPTEFIRWSDSGKDHPFYAGMTISQVIQDIPEGKSPFYYGLDNGGIDDIKTTINHYNTSTTPPTGAASFLSPYYDNFKGMTWEDSEENDDTGDPSSPAKDTVSPNVYHKLSMPGLEKFKTDFYASYVKNGDNYIPIANNPTLRLKKIPYKINIITKTIAARNTDPDIPSFIEGEYGDVKEDYVITPKNDPLYKTIVTINGRTQVITEPLTLPVKCNLQPNMGAPKNELFDDAWNWKYVEDANQSKSGVIDVEISYVRGDILVANAPETIDFGERKVSSDGREMNYAAEAVVGDLSVLDTHTTKVDWNVTAEVKDGNPDLFGSTLSIMDKKLSFDGGAQLLTENDAKYLNGDTYMMLKSSDTNKYVLTIPEVVWSTGSVKKQKYVFKVEFVFTRSPSNP